MNQYKVNVAHSMYQEIKFKMKSGSMYKLPPTKEVDQNKAVASRPVPDFSSQNSSKLDFVSFNHSHYFVLIIVVEPVGVEPTSGQSES
jgi:hypothetical protein